MYNKFTGDYSIESNTGKTLGIYSTEEEAKKALGGENVHYFDLTPQAKESFLKKGQPMFAVAPALGITDEDSRREILEKLFNSKK